MEKNYAEVLSLLMKGKKKKPNQAEQEKFFNAWLEMVLENGFNELAESYLYHGFGFCNASAFVKFLQQSNEPQQELLKLMNGKHFADDSNTTFRVLINTLVLLLNEKAPVELIVTIMKYLPKACQNKEGKPLGTAPKSFKKYFLSALNPYVELPSLCNCPADPPVINTFCTLISALLDDAEASVLTPSDRFSDQLNCVRKWIDGYAASLLASNSINNKNETDGKNSAQDTPNFHPVAAIETQPHQTESASKQGGPENTENSNPADQVIALLSQIKALTSIMSRNNTALEKRIADLTEALSEKNNAISVLKSKLNDCNEQIITLTTRLTASEADGLIYKQQITEKDRIIQQKDQEIAEHEKMAEILSRDRARQSSEVLQKLASRIRVEYRDFYDAVELPMTSDLGENMRLQLQNVFDILEKGGMKIK